MFSLLVDYLNFLGERPRGVSLWKGCVHPLKTSHNLHSQFCPQWSDLQQKKRKKRGETEGVSVTILQSCFTSYKSV